MELVAMLLSLFITSSYGTWSEASLNTACEDLPEYPCPGEPCEQCTTCVTRLFAETCSCLPASFLALKPNGETVCIWTKAFLWPEPSCCEAYKGSLKRNSFSGNVNGSTHSLVSLHTQHDSDTNANETVRVAQDVPSTSTLKTILTNRYYSATDDNTKDIERTESELKNVIMNREEALAPSSNRENVKDRSQNGTGHYNNGKGSNQSNAQGDSIRKKPTDYRDMFRDAYRDRRDSIIMRALMNAAKKMRTDMDLDKKRKIS